jgi:hypothetical protein
VFYSACFPTKLSKDAARDQCGIDLYVFLVWLGGLSFQFAVYVVLLVFGTCKAVVENRSALPARPC